MNVKIATFSRTETILNASQIEQLIAEVQVEAEAFLATRALSDIVDVREHLVSSGKYDSFATFFITVYYLE